MLKALLLCTFLHHKPAQETEEEAKLDGLWQQAGGLVNESKSEATSALKEKIRGILGNSTVRNDTKQKRDSQTKKLQWARIMHHLRSSHAPTISPTNSPTTWSGTPAPTAVPTHVPLQTRLHALFPKFNFSAVQSASPGNTLMGVLKRPHPFTKRQTAKDHIDQDWGSEYAPGKGT
jgi:hypothetical protein